MHTALAARTSAATATRASSTMRTGFTVVELLVATVVLAVGLVALTSAGAAIVRLESRGELLARIAAAGETRLELLRSTGCTAAAGQSRIGRIEERWSVTPERPHVATIVDSVMRSAAHGAAPSSVYVFRSAVRC